MQRRKFRIQHLHEVSGMAEYLAEFCPRAPDAKSGFFELLLNAIEHGNLEIGFEQKTRLLAAGRWAEEVNARAADTRYADRSVDIVLTCHPFCHEVRIADGGRGFNWRQALDMDPDHTHLHGRGLIIAQSCGFDRLRFNMRGNEVVCISKRLD